MLRKTRDSQVSNRHIKIVSPINPFQEITVKLANVSISGFLGYHSSSLGRVLLPGASVKLYNSNLQGVVVSTEDDVLRVEWVAGNEKSQSAWLKFISNDIFSSTDTLTPIASEVLSVFCESGALGGEFLRSQRPFKSEIEKQIETENDHIDFIHRWIDRKPNGEVSGHVSSIKMGDNCWLLGDIAGGIRTERKIAKDFVPKFFVSFHYFCKRVSPCPRTLIIYTKGHPYWKGFTSSLSNERAPLSEKSSLAYTRTSRRNIEQGKHKVDVLEIQSFEYVRIESIELQLQSRGLRSFSAAFDFCIDRFGSPRLEESVVNSGNIFLRKYFEVICDKARCLVVLTQYPIGKNPNRIIDAAWCFPLDDFEQVTSEHWNSIVAAVRTAGLKLGIAIPSFRRLMSGGDERIFECEEVIMDCQLVHPDLLDYFRCVV